MAIIRVWHDMIWYIDIISYDMIWYVIWSREFSCVAHFVARTWARGSVSWWKQWLLPSGSSVPTKNGVYSCVLLVSRSFNRQITYPASVAGRITYCAWRHCIDGRNPQQEAQWVRSKQQALLLVIVSSSKQLLYIVSSINIIALYQVYKYATFVCYSIRTYVPPQYIAVLFFPFFV